MGCGESKAAVDTSNTILRRKKSNAGDSSKKRKDIGTIPETATDCDSSVANSTLQPQQQQQEAAAASSSGEQVVNQNNADVVVARHFFSSRKLDEEGIDGIISEGRSGTSDYYTPRHKANVFFKVEEGSNAVEGDKELLPADECIHPFSVLIPYSTTSTDHSRGDLDS